MFPKKVTEALNILVDYFDEEKSKHDEYLHGLFEQAKKSKNEWILWNAEAMMHANLKVKPTTERLGYALANAYSNKTISSKNRELLDSICAEFDKADYIFRTTHYDEYENGHYFRRS